MDMNKASYISARNIVLDGKLDAASAPEIKAELKQRIDGKGKV